MKKWLIRCLVCLLALAMVIPMMACANNENDDPKDDPREDPGDDPSENPERPEVAHGVPDKMFNAEFNVLHFTVTGSHENYIPWEEIATETADDGDIMTKDVYGRNAWLEENYGITVTCSYVGHDTIVNQLSTSIGGGDDEWQLFDQFGFGLGKAFGQEYFLKMQDLDYIDFSHPWWVQDSIDALSLGDYVEFAASDMLLLDKGATTCIFYNIPLADEVGISGMYDDVRNKEWTMEQLAEYAEYGNAELNGDDIMDGNDRYGMICGDDPVLILYECSGRRFINKDEDGEFYYQYGDDDSITAMIDIFDTIMYSESFFNLWLHKNDAVKPDFKSRGGLFTFGMVKGCRSYRDMEDDYGILPIPMLDDRQNDYQSWVHSYHDSLFAVPVTVNDLQAVGAALELLAYYSYYHIQDDFYDTIICGRGTRDDESIEMLKIIFSNRKYDLGIIKDVDSFTDHVLRYTKTGDTNLASQFESARSKLEQHIEDLNDLLHMYN